MAQDNTSRREFENFGVASNGAVYITAGQTSTIQAWAFIPMENCVIGSVTAKVYNNTGVLTNLAGIAVSSGQIPLPNCKSFTLTSGSGFLLRAFSDR